MKDHPSSIDKEAKLTISMDGQVVAKYCDCCKRYTKGASAHFTTEHKGSGKDEAKPNDVSPTASLAAIDDCPVLFRCEVPNYDTPVVPSGDLNLAAADDDDSVDSCYHAFFAVGSSPDVEPPLPSDGPTPCHLNFYRGQGR